MVSSTTNRNSADSRWWVLQTRPRMEKCVARKLLLANVSFFLPLHTRRWRTQGRWVTSHLPLFTGYLFLRGESEARLAAMQTNVVAMCCGSPASSAERNRGNSSEKKLLISNRASAAPRQKCTP